MINLDLTNQEAIQLEMLIAMLREFKAGSLPAACQADMLASVVTDEAIAAHEKLRAELDNMLQAQRLVR